MDAFSYLSVLISLILGLAITQVLKGFRGIMQSRARLIGYWPTVLWAVLIMVIAVQSWWSMFGMRSMRACSACRVATASRAGSFSCRSTRTRRS